MVHLLKLIGVAAILTATSIPSSGAGEATPRLSEGAGLVTRIGDNAIAVTYWVSRPEGFDVVTTIDTDAGGQSPNGSQSVARFSSRLLPGQSQEISVPSALGDRRQSLQIRRVEDRIEVDGIAHLD